MGGGSMLQDASQGPLTGPGDAQLLEAIGQGDRVAFRTLYDRYAGRLLAYVRAMGGGRVPVEDVVQEVFVALFQKAHQYRPALGSPEGWIFTITRHKVVDVWRAHSPVVDLGGLDLEQVVGAEETVDGTLAPSLRKALGTLTPEQREPLMLAYFGGLTHEETAQRLQLPLGTVKARIRSSLLKMRDLVGSP